MAKVDDLKKHLHRGQVYRRDELARWSKSVDRHLAELVDDGTLEKLSQGLYYYPKISAFGKTPPEENMLIRKFLKDDRFLMTSPNLYNSLGVGTSQLYNTRKVYNHKRHGEFILGNRKFDFQVKPHFPAKLSQEFLLVDLVNNLDSLAEDREQVLKNVLSRLSVMDKKKMSESVRLFANARSKKLMRTVLDKESRYAC